MDQINMYQIALSIPIFLLLAFGIGFVFNVLVKTTWLPLIIYFFIMIGVFVKLGKVSAVDIFILGSGLVGAALSGWTIKLLRTKGYKMF